MAYHTNKNTGGYWMLVALVTLLFTPIAIDRLVHGAPVQATTHADAASH